MYSENFVNYLLRYQMEEEQECEKNEKCKKWYFSPVYSKIIAQKYAEILADVR